MEGRFELNIKQQYSNPVRIRAFANEQLCFYMHKNGKFMKKLETTLNRVELKKYHDN